MFDVVGEVDLRTAPLLLDVAREELAAGCRALVLDLAGVSLCSARCIGALAEIRGLAARHGASVRFAHPSQEVRSVADLTGSRVVVDGAAPHDGSPASTPVGAPARHTGPPEVVVSGPPRGQGWVELATILGPAGVSSLARWCTWVGGRLRRRPT